MILYISAGLAPRFTTRQDEDEDETQFDLHSPHGLVTHRGTRPLSFGSLCRRRQSSPHVSD